MTVEIIEDVTHITVTQPDTPSIEVTEQSPIQIDVTVPPPLTVEIATPGLQGAPGAPGEPGAPGTGSVNSVNGDSGPDIVLDASDVGASPTGHTHTLSSITDVTSSPSEINILDGATISTAELNYLAGVTSAIQAQINSKANSSHSHVIADLPVASSGESSSTKVVRADDSRLSNARTPTAHTHIISETTGLQTALDGKASLSSNQTITGYNKFSNHLHLIGYGSQIGLILGNSQTPDTINSRKVGSIRAMNYAGDGSSGSHYWESWLVDAPSATENIISIGGRVGSPNTSATRIELSTQSDTTTTGAVVRVSISNSGVVTIPGTLTLSGLTASRALVTGSGGAVGTSAVTSTELGYLGGVTSAIQTQLDAKVSLTGAQTIAGVKTFSSNPVVPGLVITPVGAAVIEIGRVDGVASTPVIDFHSGATATDYDSRIVAAGGTGVSGGGILQFTALGGLVFQGNTAPHANNTYTLGTTALRWSTIYGTALDVSSATISGLTASRAIVTGSGGVLAVSATTSTEVGYLSGVTSAIQTQLNSKAPTVHEHDPTLVFNSWTGTPNAVLAAADDGLGLYPDLLTIDHLAHLISASGAATVGKIVAATDSRLSDARTPTAHTHPISEVTNLQTSLDGKMDKVGGGKETVAALSATTGTATGNLANASVFTVSPTGNITLAFSNVPNSVAVTTTVIITQDGTVRTVTMPSGTVWMTPVPTQVASKVCHINLMTVNGGTTWYAWGTVQP